MPITFERHDERRRILMRALNPTTFTEARSAFDRQLADGVWSYGVLCDARDLTKSFSPQEVKRLMEAVEGLAGRHGPRGPVAIVSDSDTVYGMSRMYATLGEQSHQNISVFRTIAEAERWLDALQPPQ